MNNLREAILNAPEPEPEEVDTSDEWGHKVYVRVMTGLERDEYDQFFGKNGEARKYGLRELLARLCTVDATGDKIFQAGDEELLAKKGHLAVTKIWPIAARLNRLLPETKKAADAPAA